MAASSRPDLTETAEPQGPVTVVVRDARVTYRVESSETSTVRPSFGKRLVNRLIGRSNQTSVHALKGISFEARAGESIGIIGSNGSGKSTLLRVIAGLETLTSGTVLAESNPVLLGVNAALVPHLSGVENVRIGLLALGLSPADVRRFTPDVIDLAGIDASIYRPMRTYSSGMASRLRFAIAAAANPHILLIDEALSTGDAAFKDRSDRKMTELRERAGTVFLVSHAAQTVEETCTRAIWINQGSVVLDGPALPTTRFYRQWAASLARGEMDRAQELLQRATARNNRPRRPEVTSGMSPRMEPQ